MKFLKILTLAAVTPFYLNAELLPTSNTAAIVAMSDGDFEVKGFFGTAENLEVSLRLKSTGKAEWYPVGKKLEAVFVENANERTGVVTLVYKGKRQTLHLAGEGISEFNLRYESAVKWLVSRRDERKLKYFVNGKLSEAQREKMKEVMQNKLYELFKSHPEYLASMIQGPFKANPDTGVYGRSDNMTKEMGSEIKSNLTAIYKESLAKAVETSSAQRGGVSGVSDEIMSIIDAYYDNRSAKIYKHGDEDDANASVDFAKRHEDMLGDEHGSSRSVPANDINGLTNTLVGDIIRDGMGVSYLSERADGVFFNMKLLDPRQRYQYDTLTHSGKASAESDAEAYAVSVIPASFSFASLPKDTGQ